jgi:hypothetical protein
MTTLDRPASVPPSSPAAVAGSARRRDLTLADLRGRSSVLDFWTFCCVNCLHVLDELGRSSSASPTSST